MKPTILLTARDVGAAQHIGVIAKFFFGKGFIVVLLASGAAFEYFRVNKINAKIFCVSDDKDYVSHDATQNEIKELIKAAYQILDEINPDVIICGLSTYDYGIDEAVLYLAEEKRLNIPSFQFLDTWGEMFNYLYDGYPDIYLGFDESILKYADKKFLKRIRIVGAPKYENYSQINTDHSKKKIYKKFGIQDHEKVIGYFGQKPDEPGHTYNFIKLLASVKECQKRFLCKFLVRAHPGWKKMYDEYWDLIRENNIDAIDITEEPIIEDLLCACDIVATSYSTVAIDHAFLSSYSPSSIGVVVYLLEGQDIKKYLTDTYGYWKNPLLEKEIGFYINQEENTYDKINSILTQKKFSEVYYKRCQELTTGSPCNNIFKLVSSNLQPK